MKKSTLMPALRTVLVALLVTGAAPAFAQTPETPPAPDAGRSTGDASTAQAVQLTARPAAVIAGTAEWEEGFDTITKSFNDLRAAMDKAGLKPGGKPLTVFVETDDQGFKFQAMIPLEAAPPASVTLAAPVKIGETPAGRTMRFEHRSAYDDIDSTYEAITAYLDEKGIEAKPMFVEEYVTEPKAADDTDLKVDIYVFIK
ncbi:MAG: transcription activator effector binding [Hyphomicrobiales bacterium]|nr:transcription activator effector binding [Hyphomicrobiales bacterium]